MTSAIHNEQSLRHRINFVQYVLLALLIVVIGVPLALGWWIRQQYPAIAALSIENVHVVGASALCPGDELVVAYTFHASGSGVLVRDSTTWRTKPPETAIFSMPRRFILTGPVDQELVEAWQVPRTYLSPETGREYPLLPGEYERHIAISSPTRSTAIAIGTVTFSVRSDCEG